MPGDTFLEGKSLGRWPVSGGTTTYITVRQFFGHRARENRSKGTLSGGNETLHDCSFII